MRERLHQLGGMLDIESGERGTIVRASVPVTLSQS
jgi:signal transduction histidine kinase